MEVAIYVVVIGVFVFLSLLFYLLFCLLHGSYAAPHGVLWVLLLLGGSPTF